MKICSLETHQAMKADDRLWLSLKFIGVQDLGDGERLELRNCSCASTLSRVIGVEVIHPTSPVRPDSDYITMTSGTRGRYYLADNGSRWFCEEDGAVVRWREIVATSVCADEEETAEDRALAAADYCNEYSDWDGAR